MSTRHAQGTHLYVDAVAPETPATPGVFYSRRGGGPYYRWDYHEGSERWQGSRVSPDSLPKSLRAAGRIAPDASRSELLNHYQD